MRLQGYSEVTLKRYDQMVGHFINWLKRKKYSASTIDYAGLMKYAKHLKGKKVKDRTVNSNMLAIRTYFNYLIACGERQDNPAEDIKIKLPPRTHHYNILSELELEDLYHSFEVVGQDDYIKATAFRNKIIVGLMVFQGLGNASLAAIENEHLKLHRGKIYVPSTTKTKARNLELKSFQIVDLLHYQNEVRPLLNQRVKVNEHKLFPTGHNTKFTAITEVITKKLKRYNSKVDKPPQIRASVITHWLKQHNVRRVQFLAGHMNIKSTEFYKQDHIDKLQNIVDRFHPLG